MPAELEPSSVAVVLGTRPEVVKLGGIIRLLGDEARIVHTGQHFDPNLSDVFFDEMGLPAPTAHLGVGGAGRAAQVAEAITGLDELFAAGRPQAVVVQGDTNSVLAGAIAANANDIPLVHVEAGLRSFDRRMPEEHNRVVADHLADLCLAPNELNRENLAAEGIDGARVVVTGNTVVEAVGEHLPAPDERLAVLGELGVEPLGFVLATMHRPENVDDPAVLAPLLDGLARLPLPVLFPLHPRTAGRVDEFGLGDRLRALIVIPPVGYSRFLALFAEAAFAVSDSGGIQEEASVLKRPVIVVRRSTERPEVLGTFAELVQPGRPFEDVAARWAADPAVLREHLGGVACPYGDGTASVRSVAALRKLLA